MTEEARVPPLALVLCPYVLAKERDSQVGECPLFAQKSVSGLAGTRCPFAHDASIQTSAFAVWAQWTAPAPVAPRCSLNVDVLDWAHLKQDATRADAVRYVVVNNLAKTGMLTLEEVFGLSDCFSVAGQPPPVDGYLKLSAQMHIAPGGHRSFGFVFEPRKEGFHECQVTLSFNGRSCKLQLELHALVLNEEKFSEFGAASSRLIVGRPFVPLEKRRQVWSAVASPMYQAVSIMPNNADGVTWTPVELAYWLESTYGFQTVGTTRPLTHSLAKNAVKSASLYPLLYVKGRGKLLGSRMREKNVIEAVTPDHLANLARLLMLEELALDAQAQSFDIYDRELVVARNYSRETGEEIYTLNVVGASEQRPQLLKGDSVRLRCASGGAWELLCTVNRVDARISSVFLAVPSRTGIHLAGAKVHARFSWSRVRYRRMYNALKTDRARELVDPAVKTRSSVESYPWTLAHSSFEPPCFLSSEQKKVVCAVLNSMHRKRTARASVVEPPVMMLGAAGTGKTEVIMAVLERIFAGVFDENRLGGLPSVLVCAPSNGAADVLALRLDKSFPELCAKLKILRLNSYQRPVTELLGGDALVKYCYFDPVSGLHGAPPPGAHYDIVISTCATAGWLAESNRMHSGFDLVVIDECAQATEPEALIPISLARGPILLCGDLKQFGPQLRSPHAIKGGLKSLLDRLAELPSCRENVISLTHNFRAHPQLMAISSALFYDNAVKASLPQLLAEKALAFEDLNGSDCPVCFYGVAGQDCSENESVWNVAECFKVAELVQRVIGSEGLKGTIAANDIGIVAPFYRQVRLIREVLRDRGLRDVRVGSVADYQGQEELVLIVSAVRGTARYVNRDVANNVGLIFNDRSFNVCVTRAKCLLLCVGNPRVLSVDRNWRKLLSMCIVNGSYHGLDYDMEQDRHFTEEELNCAPLALDYAALGVCDYAFDLPWDLGS